MFRIELQHTFSRKDMSYLEFNPAPLLRPYVSCYWEMKSSRGLSMIDALPIIPDGTQEIVFNLADAFRRHKHTGSVETQPKHLVVGQMRSAVTIEPLGNVDLFGVRFRTAGAYPFFRFNLIELTDKIEPIDAVWGPAGARLIDRILNAETTPARISILESFLLRHLAPNPDLDQLLTTAFHLLTEHKGLKRVSYLCDRLGVSSRTLERAFQAHVGLTPKTLSRIVRFQEVVALTRSPSDTEMYDRIMDLGFYDQPHLVREFRLICGRTPQQFISRPSNLADHFIRPLRLTNFYNTARITNE
jgi:AraC-like DNA-binding protein